MSPYPGLLPFGVEDAEAFHGRERLAGELRAAAAGPGLLILVGPSGSGKTSLLHAGFLAHEERPWLVTTPRTPLPADVPELVVVDELEELFTLDRPERDQFLHTLANLGTRTRVVLALDAACYGLAAEHPELAKALRDNQLLVEPMTPAERRAAVENAGPELEDGLADEILRDTTTLPQLAHALWATWRQRTGNLLTVEAYRAESTVEATAERVYAELAAHEQEAARRMLPRLVRLGDGTPDTTVPVPREELLAGLPAAERVIDLLTDARLLSRQGTDIRISHDAVLQAWPRLHEWLTAERDWRPARHRFTEDAQRWQDAGRAKSLLYRGELLAAATRSAAAAPSRASDLDAATAEFLAQSWRGEQRRLRRRRTVLALLAVLAVVAPAGLVGAAKFAQQADQARTRDLARSLAAEAEFLRDGKPGLAKQLSVLSYRLDREAGHRAMLNSQNTPGVIADEKIVTDVVPDADGDLLAVVAVDEIILRGRERSGRIPDLTPGAVAVSRDATRLVAAVFDNNEAKSGVLRFYDVADPSRPRQTAELPMPAVIRSLVLSEDGDTLYAGTDGGDVLIWDLARPDTPKSLPKPQGHGAAVDSLAVAPRRGLLASASVDGQVRLWDVVDPSRPAPVATLPGEPFKTARNPREPLHRIAFDPSGLLLATSAAPGPAKGPHVWRLDDPAAPQQIPYRGDDLFSRQCDDPVLSLAFSSHGDQLAVVCGSKWRLLTHTAEPAPGRLSQSFTTDHTSLEPGPVVFDPTGRRLLQVDATGVFVWDVGNPDQPGVKGFVPELPGTGGQISYRKTADRHLMAVKGVGTNNLWDVTDPATPKKLYTAPAPNLFTSPAIALSENGELFAAAELYDNGKMVGVSLRDTENPGGAPLAMIEDLDNGIAEIAFSPTRPLLVISDVNGRTKSNKTPASLRFYDIADPARPRQVAKLPIEAWDAEFSPDGTVLTVMAHGEVASLPYDPKAGKQLRGLDLTDPAQPTELWRKPLPAGLEAEFAHSPDGSLFAAFDSTQTLRLWRVRDRKPAGDPVKVAVGNRKTTGELAFSPDGKRIALLVTLQRGSDFVSRPEIWDVSDPDAPVQQLYLPAGGTWTSYDLEFGPDGTTLALGRASAGIDLWDTDLERIVSGLCNAPGDPITEQQWRRYLPGRDYRPPCA